MTRPTVHCPTCHAPAGRIRTIAEGAGWRHYYACLRVGDHRFATIEQVAGKPHVDKKQVGRVIEQIGKQLDSLRAVLG